MRSQKALADWRLLNDYRSKCREALNTRRLERSNEKMINTRKSLKFAAEMANDPHAEEIEFIDDMIRRQSDHILDYETFDSDSQKFMDDIQLERLQDENIIHQLQEIMEMEETQLNWLIENQYSVVCFKCKRDSLSLIPKDTQTQVICHGCNFNFSVNFPLTDQQFHDRVNFIIDQHSQGCCQMFNIEMINYPSTNIKFECKSCNFAQLIFS